MAACRRILRGSAESSVVPAIVGQLSPPVGSLPSASVRTVRGTENGRASNNIGAQHSGRKSESAGANGKGESLDHARPPASELSKLRLRTLRTMRTQNSARFRPALEVVLLALQLLG